MLRWICIACLVGWLSLGPVVAAPGQPAAPAPPPDARQQMSQRAERFAQPPDTPEESAPAGDAEQTPLGTPAAEQRGLGDGARGSGGGGWVLSTLAALGLVIGLILTAKWAYVKLGGKVIARPSRAVEVLSRTVVGPKNHVLLLRVGQRVLVVGDSTTGLRTLADLNDPEEVATLLQSVESGKPASVSQGFHDLIGRFNRDYDTQDERAAEGGDRGEARLDRTRDSLAGLRSRLGNLSGKGGAA